MRNAFIKTMQRLGQDERVMLLIADTGQFILRDFQRDYPDRFLNVGIAEANLIGIAAGLALAGKVPFVYSIAAFYSRCADQIRVDVCYNNTNVKIVGVGAGIAYGTMGPTHHTIEDLAVFRAFPGMTILAPSDPIETAQATEIALQIPGPVYLRLALAGEPTLHDSSYHMQREQADLLREGKDVTLIATGRVVKNIVDAAALLATHQITCRVLNIHTVKPIDRVTILQAAADTTAVITVEEHNITGGLGSAVAEILAENGISTKLWRFGLRDTFCQSYGSQEYLHHQYGLTGEDIAKEVLSLYGRHL